jgi:hypothetical protein
MAKLTNSSTPPAPTPAASPMTIPRPQGVGLPVIVEDIYCWLEVLQARLEALEAPSTTRRSTP